MNYVDSGTFWVVVITIAAAIYAVWNKLKKWIDAIENDLKETKKILSNGARELAQATTNDNQKLNGTLADLYNGLADVQQVLEVLEDGANKATQDKLKEIHKKRGDK